MWFLDNIVEWLDDATNRFYDAYLEVSGWISPFNLLYLPLYYLYRAFYYLTWYFGQFNEWLDWAAGRIDAILSISSITAYFQTWIDYATDAWDWVKNALGNVWLIVESWWSSTKLTVQAWIDTATEGFDALRVVWDEVWTITWPQWTATLEVLGSEVSDFFTNTLPTLLDYLKLENWWNGKLLAVDGLIGSTLAEWFPFYDDVAEFFSDPGEFLLSRLTDWFLGRRS